MPTVCDQRAQTIADCQAFAERYQTLLRKSAIKAGLNYTDAFASFFPDNEDPDYDSLGVELGIPIDHTHDADGLWTTPQKLAAWHRAVAEAMEAEIQSLRESRKARSA